MSNKNPIQSLSHSVDRNTLFELKDFIPGMEYYILPDGTKIVEKTDHRHRHAPIEVLRFIPTDQYSDDYIQIQRAENITDEELLIFLASFPTSLTNLRNDIRAAFSLPELTDRHFEQASIQASSYNMATKNAPRIIERIRDLPKPQYVELPLSKADSIHIKQGDAAIIRGNPVKHAATKTVRSCLAVIIKSPDATGLIHMDDGNVESLHNILSAIRNSDDIPLEVTLRGGLQNQSELVLANIVEFLEKQPNLRISYADVLLSYDNKNDAVVISSTGEIMVASSYDLQNNLSEPRDFTYKPPMLPKYAPGLAAPINLVYCEEGARRAILRNPPVLPFDRTTTAGWSGERN